MSSSVRRHLLDVPHPDPSDTDSDLDLDLDIDELDPTTTSSNGPVHSSLQARVGQRASRGLESRIPLKTLHSRITGGTPRRARNYGQLRNQHNSDDEDSRYYGRGTADSRASNSQDDAPLLSGARRKSSARPGPLARLTSRLGLNDTVPASDSQSTPPPESTRKLRNGSLASSRTVLVGRSQAVRYPANSISNAKYTPWSFLPLTLYNEFSFFFNLYFLLVALSQIIPALRIGYLSTYTAPLAFVLTITLGKEALDDIARRRRDAEANSTGYTVLRFQHEPRITGANKSHRYSTDHAEDESNLQGDESSARPERNVQEVVVKSRDLKVGDVLKMGKDERVPADVIILKSYVTESTVAVGGGGGGGSAGETSDDDGLLDLVEPLDETPLEVSATIEAASRQSTASEHKKPATNGDSVGETFIRTDQLDGETDWKLRLASPLTQNLKIAQFSRVRISAGKPDKQVNDFVGTVELLPLSADGMSSHVPRSAESKSWVGGTLGPAHETISSTTSKVSPLNIDNTAWANTVLASNSTTIAVVVYTGSQTRSALSTSLSRSKTGLLEYEINALTKILCIFTLLLSALLVVLEGFERSTQDRKWYIALLLYLILFSTIIPISLRVNLDMGKSVYAWFIERDQDIPGTVVRTSTIPEELGRVEYLLSDKTGTLTQNEMEMKKVHVGTVSYANEAMDEVSAYIKQACALPANALMTPSSTYTASGSTATGTRTRREIGSRVRDVVLALALCHNVTPTSEEEHGEVVTTYQASSPDEIAIVRWTESVGLRLMHRDRKSMVVESTATGHAVIRVRILELFPFTSEGKRMGIIAQFHTSDECTGQDSGEIWFFQKGADTVMTSIVAANDWLDEETANMAREGLRTLVVGRKKLSASQYRDFASSYKQASLSLHDRDAGMAQVVQTHLERDLELLGVTGVEDKLQKDVKASLELLRNAGIKIWMLTGDKIETARCVAVSAKLVARGQYVHTVAKLQRPELARETLDVLRSKPDSCLLIDGESLALLLTDSFRSAFIALAVTLPVVIACRCSPMQKAEIAKLIRSHTKKRICCIGDGGNDVSMIQAADVGVGIVGKEGRQASLAADFSITQFCHLTKLLVWHGRNSYKRSAKLAQFVIHRGLLISVCQTMFSIASKFEPNALYRDWLLVGYATLYTMAPVFSLVLDRDVDESLANLYPELYRELTTGRSLSLSTFLVWVLVSIYQGSMIQGLSQILVSTSGNRMVALSFTVLVINELIMVAMEVVTWHPVMIFSLLGTAAVYFGSLPFLGGYFDLSFVVTSGFWWRVAVISAASLIPPYTVKMVRRRWRPPSYRKVQGL